MSVKVVPSEPFELVLVLPLVLVLTAVAGAALWGAHDDERFQSIRAEVEDVRTFTSGVGTKGGPYFVVEVRYRYDVNGKSYSSTRRMRHWEGDVEREFFKKPADAQQRVAEYRRQPSITAYYDPTDPAQSLRERRPRSEAYFPGGLGLVGFVYSAVRLLIWRLRRARSS